MEKKWKHPGGKLIELGASSLTESEILSIIISSGIKGKSAEMIAEEIINKYGSITGLSNRPLEELLKIKGLSDVKIVRIAAALEIARRISERKKKNDGEKDKTY